MLQRGQKYGLHDVLCRRTIPKIQARTLKDGVAVRFHHLLKLRCIHLHTRDAEGDHFDCYGQNSLAKAQTNILVTCATGLTRTGCSFVKTDGVDVESLCQQR